MKDPFPWNQLYKNSHLVYNENKTITYVAFRVVIGEPLPGE